MSDNRDYLKKLGWLERSLFADEGKKLEQTFRSGETIIAASNASVESATGKIFCTSVRLIFISKSWFTETKSELFFDRSSTVDFSKSYWGSEISVRGSGKRMKISGLNDAQFKNFCEMSEFAVRGIRERNIQTRSDGPTTANQLVQSTDLILGLERLSDLHRKGALSDQEFVQAKKKLIE